jgi:hypothetical protein
VLLPWLSWSIPLARGRVGSHCASAPLGRSTQPGGTSYAGARGYRAQRSYAEGRAADPTPASRAGCRTEP